MSDSLGGCGESAALLSLVDSLVCEVSEYWGPPAQCLLTEWRLQKHSFSWSSDVIWKSDASVCVYLNVRLSARKDGEWERFEWGGKRSFFIIISPLLSSPLLVLTSVPRRDIKGKIEGCRGGKVFPARCWWRIFVFLTIRDLNLIKKPLLKSGRRNLGDIASYNEYGASCYRPDYRKRNTPFFLGKKNTAGKRKKNCLAFWWGNQTFLLASFCSSLVWI